ncbi:MAG: hypothetical protein NTW96_02505 [Planctomycetia bacterium]|nr:hypothetical protein [Planctomycetia bacterium]
MANPRKSKLRKIERKRRKEKEKRRAEKTPPLAYTGTKYRKAKYVRLLLVTETAIHEADVVADRKLTDDVVWAALVDLIDLLRKGPLPSLDNLAAESPETFSIQDFLVYNIVDCWKLYFEDSPPVGRDVLVGILRSTLGSIEVWGTNRPGSRGYLDYLEGFLHKLGVSTRRIDPSSLVSSPANSRLFAPSFDRGDK